MDYTSNTTLTQIAIQLKASQNIVLTTHAKPDGDALGSVVALGQALQLLGKQVQRWVMPPVPRTLDVLSGGVELMCVGENNDGLPTVEPDCIVVLDTGAWSQLEGIHEYLQSRYEKTIVIDHHLHGDEVGKALYVDAKAAAACQIVAQLIDELGVTYDRQIADALFVGLASDTGWFRFSNTTDQTHELAARLLRCGVDHADLYGQLEQGERPEKLRLLIRALDSLQLINGGKAAVMTLRTSDFEESGAKPEETERFVDLPQIVREVQVVVLITEQVDGPARISFRSKPGKGAVNVSKLASQFGGGGHARASGAKINLPIDEVQQKIVEALGQLEEVVNK